MKRKRKKYWYRFHWGECPVCGRDASYKERVYGEKPKDANKRHIQLPYFYTYDHCVG